ncbi:MAG: fimbrillin family protein [Phocaeicola sp.]
MGKKFLTAIAAFILVVSSCSKHDAIDNHQDEVVDSTSIKFDAFVGDFTAPALENSFNDFRVYGYQGKSGVDEEMTWSIDSPNSLMENMAVTKGSDGVWKTASSTFWPAEETHVQFFAFSPTASAGSGIEYLKSSESGHIPALRFTVNEDQAKQVDLLCAESAELVTAEAIKDKRVELKFTHALTKLKFSANVQPKQRLYISHLSLHNLGSKGSFSYNPADREKGSWTDDEKTNRGFAVKLIDEAKTGIVSTEEISITTADGAALLIPQAREKVDVSSPKAKLFSENETNSYIKVVYSLQNSDDNSWIVGSGSEVEKQVTAYIPWAVDFKMNQLGNCFIPFGKGNYGYHDNGIPIATGDGLIQVEITFTDWDKEEIIDVTPEPAPENAKMALTVAVSQDKGMTYRLPFIRTGATGNYQLTVDWGDGIAEVIAAGTPLGGKGITHTYSEEKEYTITIGSSELNFKKVQMPRIESIEREVVYNEKLLKSIDTPLLNTGASNFSGAFRGCISLEKIPADLFKYNRAITDFSNLFYYCTALKVIQADLFKYNKEATTFNGAFLGCTSLEYIPAALFAGNRVATDFHSVFYGCLLAKVSPNVFCDEETEKATRFSSVSKQIIFDSAFKSVGVQLKLEDLAESAFPALWEYSYSAAGVDKNQCFTNGKASNSDDVDLDWKK